MSVIDFILNWLGLLLWIDWRSGAWRAKQAVPAISLGGPLTRTAHAPLRAWLSFSGLIGLLFVRAVFYWNIGSKVSWTPTIDLVAIALPWRSDLFNRMLIYSVLSFGLTLFAYYSCLLLLSAVHPRSAQEQPFDKFVRVQLGFLARLHPILKLLLPFITGAAAWSAAAPLLIRLGILPPPHSTMHLWEQALVLGVSTYLVWRWFLIALFGLHLLNTYIYMGDHPFWQYITQSARNLLAPFRFVRLRKLDLSPILGIIVVFALAEFGLLPLTNLLFHRLPL